MTEPHSLFVCIDKKDDKGIQSLLDHKIDLELKNPEGQTALMYALYKKDLPTAALLIEHGADVNAQDHILNTPFLYAGASGFLDIVKSCLLRGADFSIYNRYGGTALIPAAEKGHLEIVKLLANNNGFPKDHINNLGWTALLEAVILSDGSPVHVEIVEELIKSGCAVSIADKKGVTALAHAKNNGYKEMIALLEAAGAQ